MRPAITENECYTEKNRSYVRIEPWNASNVRGWRQKKCFKDENQLTVSKVDGKSSEMRTEA